MSISLSPDVSASKTNTYLMRGPADQTVYAQATLGPSTRTASRIDSASITAGARLLVRAQGWAQGQSNAAQGQSLTNAADGGLQAIAQLVEQMRTLAVQASRTGTLSRSARDVINTQYASLADEAQRIAKTTAYNGTALTDGTTQTLRFQVGANASAPNQVTATLPNATQQALHLDATSLSDPEHAQAALGAIDGALGQIAQDRGVLGAASQTLQSAQSLAQSNRVTLTEAQSRRTARTASGSAASEVVQALVRSRSARQVHQIYEGLLPK